MRYNYVSAALVASASIAMAAPTPRSTFVVNQFETGRKIFKNGAQSVLRTYQKYARVGAVAPQHVVDAAAASGGQQGSADANPEQYDSEYLVSVNVGGTDLNLDFDTGSSDLWVFSAKLPRSEQSGHNIYSPDSSAERLSGNTWEISYGDGSGASGIVYADTVKVGPVTATSQAVEAATSISSEFQQGAGDGLLGLAFSSINTVTPDQQTTFFDTVKDSLSKPLFTANLKAGDVGSYGFGFIDDSLYSGDITYVDVDDSQGFWQFEASSIGNAIADTGTTLLYIPDSAVSDYYSQVSSAENSQSDGGYVFDCDADLPDFDVEIGGTTFTVPGSYINYAPASGSSCFGGIQSSSGIGLNIFGDIFLKSVYVVFDESEGSPRLGFAKQS